MTDIKPEQIPDEVVREFLAEWREDHDHKAAISAALNAWPGSYEFKSRYGQAFAIPLTENPNG